TLTLTGPNTYTGGTTITGGVLAVNNDGNLGGAAGGLTFAGGTLRTLENAFSSARPILINTTGTIDTNGVNATLSGPIGGVGGLIKLGGGNLTLTGNNTYGGGTTISEGSLTVTTTSIQGNVSNNGALVFNQAIAGTFAGDMSGAGSLTKMNGGNLTLTGTNTYTGGTTITGGTLTGNSVSLTGNIINNTALAFDQTFAGTFAGDISGSGSLLKEGAALLLLTGNLGGFTGPVTINNGEFEITTTNIPQHYALGANGVLGFAPPTGQSVTFGGTITGAGRVDIDGAGTVSFPSTYTYSGQTTVNNGIFSLDGSLPNSPLFVMPGGTLVGNGSALSGNIGGLISPGHSIGQLTFVNSFTMAPTATYKAEIGAGGASDLIAVGTVASLDGTLNVVSVDPRRQLKGQTYIILTANQRTSAFATLTSDNRIKYTIEYLPNAVRIITGNLQDLTHAFASTDGSNAAIMGRYLDSFDDSIPLGSDLDSVLRVLDTYLGNEDIAGLTAALDQLQPSLFKEFGFLSFNHNALLNKTLHFQQQHLRDTARFAAESRRLEKVEPKRLNAFYKLLGDNSFRALSSRSNFASQNIFAKGAQKQRGIGLNFAMNNQGIENRPSGMPINQRIKSGKTTMWIQSYGQLDDKGANSHGNVGIKSRTGGVTLGADYQVMNNTFVGLLGGYSTTFFDWKQARGNGTMNSGYGGVYGSWMDKCGLYVEGQFIAGNDHIKSTRNIAFSTINRAAKESHNAFQFSTNAEVGYVVPVEPFTLQPFYNATYMAVHERGYQEHGADSLNLQVNSKTGQFYRGELGTMIYKLCMVGDVLMRPSLQVGWVQKRPVGSSRAQMSGGLVNQPQTLAVLGDNRVRNQFSAGASLSAQFKEGFYIVGNVSGEVGSGEKSGEAVLSVGYQF
ncbi:MAG: autotransporter domain-containing protein, partial [Proteobacteria bacterium]|nr:autotransporter domain-containing protein [Pseudomonadota bacterium]